MKYVTVQIGQARRTGPRRLDAAELRLTTQPARFDVSRDSSNLAIEAYVYDMPQRSFGFCSDVTAGPAPGSPGPEVWRAVAGTIAIELSPPGIRAHNPVLRRATVTLSHIVLRNAAGATVSVPGPVRLAAVAGAMSG